MGAGSDVTTPSASEDTLAPLRAALAGRYEIEREIGQGAFATVYLVHDARHDRRVKLQILHPPPEQQSRELRFIPVIRQIALLHLPPTLALPPTRHDAAMTYSVVPHVS